MEIKDIPEDLKEYEENLATGTGAYGGIVIENGKLHWYNSWVGDAGDEDHESHDVTYEAICEAREIIENLGYKTSESYAEHDYASFDIHLKEENDNI